MKLLVIGRKGQIGAELCQLLVWNHIPYVAPTRDELDITKEETIKATLKKYKPTIVVNTAGYRSPSRAEIEPSVCFSLNRDAVQTLARSCEANNCVLIHISSWRVFNGKRLTPYEESEELMPVDVLGTSFLQGEQMVRKYCSSYIILRLSWVISFRSRNRLTIYLDCMRHHKQLPAYPERYGNPTTAWDVARVILAVSRQVDCNANVSGTYHCSASEMVSETFLAETIRAEVNKADTAYNWKAIIPDNKVNFNQKRYACLDCTLLRDTFGIRCRPWRESLSTLVHTNLSHQFSLDESN